MDDQICRAFAVTHFQYHQLWVKHRRHSVHAVVMGPDSPSKMSEDHSSHKLFQVFFSDIFAFRPFKSQPATIQWQKHLTFCCNVLIVGGTHVPLPFDAGFALQLEQ